MRSRRVEILAAAVVLFASASPVMAVIEFKDGLTHDIDYQINDDVWVDYESPGLETTLNILDGATIPLYYDVRAWEDSIINMFGGAIDNNLYAYDSSQVTVSGGSMYNLVPYGSSQVTVSGGSINNSLWAYGSSQVAVSGGSMGSTLYALDSSQVTVSGGLVGIGLGVSNNAVLTIHGSDFAVNGTPVGYDEYFFSDYPSGILTGILANGDPINNGFRIGDNGKIVLVPEPATLLLLGLGGLALLRKRN